MNNSVQFRGTVLRPKVTAKRVRFDLAGNDANGKAFFIRCIAQGDAFEKLKPLVEGENKTPVHIEGAGSLFTNSFEAQGKTVREIVVAVDTFKRLPNAKTVKDSKGQARLAEGSITATFTGETLRDARKPGEYGSMMLLRQIDGNIKRFVFVRVSDGLSYEKGDIITIENARVTRLYPRGKDNAPETGLMATSDQVTVQSANGSTKASQKVAATASAATDVDDDFGDEEDLPF